MSYTYDVENRLVGASGGRTATLTYDPLGGMSSASSVATGTTRFHYDGDDLVAEYDIAGNITNRYMHGPGSDEPILWDIGSAMNCAGGSTRFLHTNHQGSVIAVADCNGNRVAVNSYDEYGIPAGLANGGAPNTGRFQYTGQLWMSELGLYYYKARMYSPFAGRFMQTDPIGYEDQVNLYAYVGNDPVNAVDRTGKRITLVAHEVKGPRGIRTGQYHLKVAILPNNQDAYRNDDRFRTNNRGARVATLGAGPEGFSIQSPTGKLVNKPNRGTDLTESGVAVAEITPGKGETEDQLIERLFSADASYKGNLNYSVPNPFSKSFSGYNSNSYAVGLLKAVGAENVPLPNQEQYPTPGAFNPLPKACFSVLQVGCQ